jgi:hypothetical protein
MLYVSLRHRINPNCFILLLKLSTSAPILRDSLDLSPNWCSEEIISQSFIICPKLIADPLFIYEFVFFGRSSSSSTSILREHVSFSTNTWLILLK